MTVFAVLPWAFLGMGALFALIGALGLRSTLRRRRAWRTVPGRVVASRLRNVGGEGGMVQVQVAYEYDGGAYRTWNPGTVTSGLGPREGQAVEVLVNPERPTQAVLAGGPAGGLAISAALLAFGVLAIGVAAAILL